MIRKFFFPAIVATSSIFAADISDISFKTADGNDTSLSAYKGKVVLIVNVASKCGFTKQYTALQKLYDDHKDKGFVVLGFPCNDFGGQEPASIKEIKDFCSTNFSVTFPIMDKVHVKGNDQHPLFKAITAKDGILPGEIKWNFGKILIDKSGKPIAKFGSTTKPDSHELTKAISNAISQ